MTYPGNWATAYPVGGHWSSSVTTPPDDSEVLTIDELKERARILPGDEESDPLMQSYIAAARQQVEQDISCALGTQTIAATFTIAPAPGEVLVLPWPPLQEILAMTAFNAAGDPIDVDVEDPTQVRYIDFGAVPARVLIGSAFNPGSAAGLWFSLKVGWTKATLPPALKFAVGLLASHYLTAGRDRTVIGTSVLDMPAGYEDAINPFRLLKVA